VSDFVVGLTGGIGSGKSTVADLFVECGAALVDTDAIAHQLTAAGGAAMSALIREFGAAVATADGAMDRQAMRSRVFADPAVRVRLEAILHPLIRQVSAERCRSAAAPYVFWRFRCWSSPVTIANAATGFWSSTARKACKSIALSPAMA
jgi:dephospho-CoA kinase